MGSSYKWDEISPISRVKFHPSETHLFSAIYRGEITSFITIVGAHLEGMTTFLTVDGSEILHQLIDSLLHYFQGFIHPRWCRIFSHQQ